MTTSKKGLQARPEKAFLDNLALIERVTASICRRNACFGDEAEEFDAEVKAKLIENDYAVLRKFQGKAKLSTYLTTVIHNLFRDYRIAKWGKWRSSAAARRLGAEAVQLETLTVRDGYSFAEAAEVLRTRLESAPGRVELAALAGKLPARLPRRIEGEEALENLGTHDGVEKRVEAGEKAATVARAQAALAEALARLTVEDRLLLKLRFQDGFTVAQIAKALRRPARPLYSRFEQCARDLRRTMEEQGLSAEDVRSILGWEATELSVDYKVDEAGKSPGTSVQS